MKNSLSLTRRVFSPCPSRVFAKKISCRARQDAVWLSAIPAGIMWKERKQQPGCFQHFYLLQG